MQFQIHDEPNTVVHFFQYKNKKFPIKYEFFQKYLHNPKIGNSDTIPLIDENMEDDIDLSEDCIYTFINCVQHVKIIFNNDNFVQLNYLGKMYAIYQLISGTNEYFIDKGIEFVIINLLNHQEDPTFKPKAYENLIEENFLDCIQNGRLLDLKIPILHRIFHQYTIKNSQFVNNQILDFLFKCLDKHKKEASSLFEFVQFNNENRSYLDLLLSKKYEDVFDTRYLNSSVIHYLHENQTQHLSEDQEDYGKYHIGDLLSTVRDLSGDKRWLECDGRCLDKDEYGQLCDLLKPTPDEGKLNCHCLRGNHDNFRGSVTGGEYFVFIECDLKIEKNNSVIVHSTKDIGDNNWASKIINLPDGRIFWELGEFLYFLNGEFVIAFLMKNDKNSYFIYVLHAKNPDENWENQTIPINVSLTCDFDFFHLYYLNNIYVIAFSNYEDGSIILYGPSFSQLEMNMKFFSNSEKYCYPSIAYGNDRWAIVMGYENPSKDEVQSIIYVANDLDSLSPDGRDQNILFQFTKDEKFCATNISYGEGNWIVYGWYNEENAALYHLKDPLNAKKSIIFDEYGFNYFHSHGYCNGVFYFLAVKKDDNALYLFYSTEQKFEKENWKKVQISTKKIEWGSFYIRYSVSYNEQRNILFVNALDTESHELFCAYYTPQSSHKLPFINPVGRARTYIKACE